MSDDGDESDAPVPARDDKWARWASPWQRRVRPERKVEPPAIVLDAAGKPVLRNLGIELPATDAELYFWGRLKRLEACLTDGRIDGYVGGDCSTGGLALRSMLKEFCGHVLKQAEDFVTDDKEESS